MRELKDLQRDIILVQKNSVSTDGLEKKVDRLQKMNICMKNNYTLLGDKSSISGKEVDPLIDLMKKSAPQKT